MKISQVDMIRSLASALGRDRKNLRFGQAFVNSLPDNISSGDYSEIFYEEDDDKAIDMICKKWFNHAQ